MNSADNRKQCVIAYPVLLDKIHAGWLGKSIGGAIGAPVENHKRFIASRAELIWPETLLPNDDLDIQLVWLEAMQERGLFLQRTDLEEMWQERCEYNFCEYGMFLNNLERGIHSPVSGAWNNDFFRESEGCPIRSEIWGMVCAGNVKLAAQYARMDGELDHADFSVEVEMFLAATAAAAFVAPTLQDAFSAAETVLPKDSEIVRMRREIRNMIDLVPSDELLWRRLIRRWGNRDASKAITNLALVFAALFRHGDHFSDCMTFCYSAGWDADCTAATAGALLGILHGTAFLPPEWVKKLGKNLCCGISVKHRNAALSELSEETAHLAVEMAQCRNFELRISDPPSIPVRPVPPPDMELEIEYPEGPALSTKQSRNVNLILTNRRGGTFCGFLSIEAPSILELAPSGHPIWLNAGKSCTFSIFVRIREAINPLPDHVLLKGKLASADGKNVWEKEFGLACPRIWQVYGPYWDMWNKTRNPECPYLHCNPFAVGCGMDSYNSYAMPEESYCDESRLLNEDLPEEDPVLLETGPDRIDASMLGGYVGQGVYYLAREIIASEPGDSVFRISRSGPCRIWLDGNEIAHFLDFLQYAENGEVVPMRLTGQKQRIVVKLVRLTDEFSFCLRVGRKGVSEKIMSFNRSDIANFNPQYHVEDSPKENEE